MTPPIWGEQPIDGGIPVFSKKTVIPTLAAAGLFGAAAR